MSTKRTFSLSILAAALVVSASGALAAHPSASPTRAEVKASVLQARAHGQLMPAGEASQPIPTAAGTSTLTSRQVRDETLQARAHGELVQEIEEARIERQHVARAVIAQEPVEATQLAGAITGAVAEYRVEHFTRVRIDEDEAAACGPVRADGGQGRGRRGRHEPGQRAPARPAGAGQFSRARARH